ncbi:SurA N-terminal domain-containing protein [bacterium]|nr:SurA N-terminal domain-containing protein [bacterium]
MITLEKIRNRSGLLLFVIGFALLAFILTDLLSSQNGGSGPTDLVVGTVTNEEIDFQVFEQRVQQTFDTQKQSNPNIDIAQIRNSVWNQMVRETVLKGQFSDLGVEVSASEIFEMVQGENPYETVKQAFSNPETGQFDRSRLLQFLKEDINNDETGQAKAQWLNFEKAILEERRNNKYNAMISKGLFVSDWQAKSERASQSEIRNVSYVQIPFNTIPDSLIEISDNDLENYIEENSEEYQQDASREIEYVVFNVTPSQEDREDASNWIEDIKTDFANSDDDDQFTRKNSDVFNRVIFVSESDLRANASSLVGADNGTVVGPYTQSSGILRLAKLVDTSNRPDSVEARHILISGANAEERIDSIKSLINSGQSFSDLAQEFSEDRGSAANGGNLEWFAEGVMVTEFNDACFSAKKGELVSVNTQFGTHLIEVTDQSSKSKKYKVAYLDRRVEYSNATYQKVFAAAGKFASETTNYDQFNENVVNQNLTKRLADGLLANTINIAGLESPRQLVKWAYDAEIGDVSDVFEFNDKIVVACLTSIKDEGIVDIEDVRSTIEPIVRNNKKSEMLLEELSQYSSLQEVESNYGVSMTKAEGISFSSSQVPSLGNEPAFVGAVFAVEEGETTNVFATSKGVCMIQVDKVIASPSSVEFASTKNSIISTLKSRSSFQVYQALLELADVKDNRADFY